MSWPLGYFGYDPSKEEPGKIAIHRTEWDHEHGLAWPLIRFLRWRVASYALTYPLSAQQAHIPYHRALGPAWDLSGFKFDPLATRGMLTSTLYGGTSNTPAPPGPPEDPSRTIGIGLR